MLFYKGRMKEGLNSPSTQGSNKMAELYLQKLVIMGSKRGAKERGLVSTLSELNSKFKERKISIETLRAKASLALGGWMRAKPDWKFVLVEVPRREDYPSVSAYDEAISNLYKPS